MGLISPWGGRWLGGPRVMRLVPGLQGARQGIGGATVAPMHFWDAAIAAILAVTRCVGEASGRVVAEAFYRPAPLLKGLLARDINVVSRLRQAAGGWAAPAPPPPGTRGRKPREGRQWPLASLVTAETPTRDRLTRYGPLTAVVGVARDVWRRDVAQQVRVVVRRGAKEPVLWVSTDRTRSARQIIELYGARCSMELTIRDLKPHVGLGDDQCTTTLAILRCVHLAWVALGLWRRLLREPLAAGWLQVTAPRVSLPEAPLSFQRLRRALRAGATRQVIVANAAPGTDLENIARDHAPLLHMLM